MAMKRYDTAAAELLDALERAGRLLSVCEFDAPEDVSDVGIIEDVLERYSEET